MSRITSVKIWNRSVLCLLIAFCLVFLVNIDSLRIVRDDWCNLLRLNALLRAGAVRGSAAIIDNSWVSRDHRIFFVSWLLQGALSLAAGFHALPYYAFILSVHGASSILLYRVLRRLTGREEPSLACGLLFLLTPTATNALFFLNNWFFVLPAFFAILLIHCYLFPLRSRRIDLAALTGVCFLGQFSGEQGLPLFYLVPSCFLFAAVRSRGAGRLEKVRRAAIPLAASAAALIVYWIFFVHGRGQSYPHADTAGLLGYADASRDQLFSFFDLRSKIFGYGSVPASAPTKWLAACLGGALFFAFRGAARDPHARPEIGAGRLIGFLLLGLAAVEIPCFYGAYIGFRPLPQTRYAYLPGGFLAVLAALLLDRLLSSRRDAPPALRSAIFSAAALYAGTLTLYSLREVWGTQKFIDQELWAALDSSDLRSAKNLLTDAGWNGLLLPFHSDAASDFQEDWGISCRCEAVRGAAPAVARTAAGEVGKQVNLLGYYVQGRNQEPWKADKSDILAVAYRPASRAASASDLAWVHSAVTPQAVEITGRRPDDGIHGVFLLFPDFDRYRKFLSLEVVYRGTAPSPTP